MYHHYMKKRENNSRSRSPSSRSSGSSLPSRKIRDSIPAPHLSLKPEKKEKPRKKKGREVLTDLPSDPIEAVNGETTALSFPGGMETLLPVPNRKPLPQISKRPGRKCLLEEIVQYAPHVYARMIGAIRIGVSLNVASEAAGINESTFFSWGWKGANDREKEVDSFFSRFYSDVRRAVAHVTADCETVIAMKKPEAWLSRGPGRIFGNPWGKQMNKRELPGQSNGSGQLSLTGPNATPPDEAIDATFTIQHTPPDEDDDDISPNSSGSPGESEPLQRSGVHVGAGKHSSLRSAGSMSLTLTPEQEFAVLQVWESIGQIQLSDSMKQAFAHQISSSPQEKSPESIASS